MPSIKSLQRQRRKARSRAKISGTAKRPRLTVYRSLQSFEAQLIDDISGVTLVSITSRKEKKDGTSLKNVQELGKKLGEQAKKKKITTCVFDRNGYAYHGKVKTFADGAREGGLMF